MNRRQFLGLGAAGVLPAAPAAPARRPNILLILADDVGYSDLGCFGGEIETPNLDRLARGGVRFTQFYNSARCCPSRASLLTGLYPHQTGIGNMTGGLNAKPAANNPEGYRGVLNEQNVMMPEVLREAGYSTYMTGKWHVGPPGPIARGFEDYYGMLHGFDSFWDPKVYTRLPAGRAARSYAHGGFYATDALTDHAIDFLGQARAKERPWFLYAAYNAAHFPLHAPVDLIDKYVPVYEKGWDVLRESRFAKLREERLIDRRWALPERSIIGPNRVSRPKGTARQQNPAWNSLDADRRTDLARRMATYAAMVDSMDRNIGRMVGHLEASGELDNTLIVFLSDNGACAEWDPFGFDGSSGPDNVLHTGAALRRMGQPGTYHSYGSAWANLCATPWRLYKHYTHEGGITTPFLAHWPRGIRGKGAIQHAPAHLVDLLPTFTDVAGATYPRQRGDAAVPPPEGVSLVPALAGGAVRRKEPICFEHEGNRAVRDGRWKLVALEPGGPWELYDMDADRTELRDLAGAQPQRVRAMARQWENWARRTKAIPWIWQPQYGETTVP
jgi:arylsulfatase